jgi:hypothetical protein
MSESMLSLHAFQRGSIQLTGAAEMKQPNQFSVLLACGSILALGMWCPALASAGQSQACVNANNSVPQIIQCLTDAAPSVTTFSADYLISNM